MAFLMKSMLSNQVKNLGLGGGGDESKEESTPSDPAAAAGMTREEYEEYQKQMVEEKMERDAAFAQKKAERAVLRVHLREKYRLPKEIVSSSHRSDSSNPSSKRLTTNLPRLFCCPSPPITPLASTATLIMCQAAPAPHHNSERPTKDLDRVQTWFGKSELDENQIQMAGDDVGLPEDLQKMVAEDQEEEEDKDSILGQLQNIQNMDMDAIKEKAQATFTEMKQAAEQKCSMM